MSIQDNIDAIDPTKPINPPLVKTDPRPTSKSVRDNFLAVKNGMQGLLDALGLVSAPSLSSMLLTGISFMSSALVTAADNALAALGKLQAQISLRATIDSPALTGVPTAPTAAAGISTPQIATTEFATLADANVLAAAKTYTDAATTGLLQDCGIYDASGNVWPSTGGSGTSGAILKGDVWYLSVGGTLGGVYYESHTSIRALIDTPGQTAANWAVLEGAFGYVPENISNKSNSTGDIASTSKYPVWAILVSWANATWQPLNSKLTAIAALATTNGYAIVGNGTTFVLQLLGTAAGKNVGLASTDVAAGNRGLPSGGTAGQVPVKIDSTDYNVQWTTVGAGSGLTNWTDYFNNSSPNGTITVSGLIATGVATDIDAVISSKGTGAILAQSPDGTSTRGDKRGSYSIDMQMIRSVSSNVCSGPYSSLLGGIDNRVLGSTAFNGNGQANIVAGQYGFIGAGRNNYVTSNGEAGAISAGEYNKVDSYCGAIIGGFGAVTIINGQQSFSGANYLVNMGDSQASLLVLKALTTNGTTTVLSCSSSGGLAVNQITCQNQQAITFFGTVTAKQKGSTNCASWKVEGHLVRGANAASTVLRYQLVSQLFNSSTWTVAIVVDATNGGCKINFTGVAGVNIAVVANIYTSEATYV